MSDLCKHLLSKRHLMLYIFGYLFRHYPTIIGLQISINFILTLKYVLGVKVLNIFIVSPIYFCMIINIVANRFYSTQLCD